MAEWVPIENSIFMTDLINRWRDIKGDGKEFYSSDLADLVRNGQLTAYDKKDWIIKAGHKIWRGQKRPPQLGLNGVSGFPDEDIIIFDMDEALILEKQLLLPAANTYGYKMVGDKFVFTESQLIKKEELYKRWAGATHEEIAKHYTEGDLDAFKYYKGPINGIIWCTPGEVYYRGQIDWMNPDYYEYRDHNCDYFLIKDMEQCEVKHPEYTGNVTPESLGLVQSDTSGTQNEDVKKIDGQERIAELEAKLAEAHATIAQFKQPTFFDFNNAGRQGNSDHILALFEDGNIDSARSWIDGKDARIAELEKQLAAKGNKALTPQQKAATVKGEKTLSAWKPAIAAMIRVAVRCGEEGKNLRQRSDFNQMFNELDAELNGEQEKFFRESLPDKHIDRLGDARKEATPSDNE